VQLYRCASTRLERACTPTTRHVLLLSHCIQHILCTLRANMQRANHRSSFVHTLTHTHTHSNVSPLPAILLTLSILVRCIYLSPGERKWGCRVSTTVDSLRCVGVCGDRSEHLVQRGHNDVKDGTARRRNIHINCAFLVTVSLYGPRDTPGWTLGGACKKKNPSCEDEHCRTKDDGERGSSRFSFPSSVTPRLQAMWPCSSRRA